MVLILHNDDITSRLHFDSILISLCFNEKIIFISFFRFLASLPIKEKKTYGKDEFPEYISTHPFNSRWNNSKLFTSSHFLLSSLSQKHLNNQCLYKEFHTSTYFNEIKDERKIILDEKSKLEEFVEHQRKKRELQMQQMQAVETKLQEAFIFKPQGPAVVEEKAVKLPMKDRIMKELNHYYHGFRLLYLDCKVAAKLLWQVLNGKTLSRRERRQVRYQSDFII